MMKTKTDFAMLGGSHYGESCAIICNGWSLPDRDLLLRIPRAGYSVIGVNTSTFEVEPGAPFLESDYHVLVDKKAWANYSSDLLERATFRGLFMRFEADRNVKAEPFVLKTRARMPFSYDIGIGVVNGGAGGVALQVAVFLGFHKIVFVALDLGGLKMEGGRRQIHYYTKRPGLHHTYTESVHTTIFNTQQKFMVGAKRELSARSPHIEIVSTSPSTIPPWDRVAFGEVFPE